ncbi:MAG: VPLPA-CTERM sorting domain-containing protein [Pseudomonadota bacterium]
MHLKKLAYAAVAITGFLTPAYAGTITPDIIFGSGNSNRGFTVATVGDLELGLRAKQRYTNPNDALGVGIVQDAMGNYLIDSTGQIAPAGLSVWNFDWSINSDITNGTTALDAYSYQIAVDFDPSAAENMLSYDPLSALSTGYYLGTNASGNGGAAFESGGDEDFSLFNVAQNSVNMGFLGAPIGAGQYRVELSAFSGSALIGSTSIDVYVDTTPAPIPLPAGGVLLLSGLAGVAALKRRKKRAA